MARQLRLASRGVRGVDEKKRIEKGWGGELGGSAKSTGVCQQSTKVAYDLVFSVMYRPKKKKKKSKRMSIPA